MAIICAADRILTLLYVIYYKINGFLWHFLTS